ncbi:MAG: hypothetical protein IJX92_03120 [Clostridia bacterium]|nr:hypothetical protein [Clostridia bacterium]
MSEAERKRRQDYKENRLKWIIIQVAAMALVAIIAIGSFIVYDNMNRTYYIHYTEKGDVDYKVFLNENDFFEEEWLGPDKAYVASLIDDIVSDFKYDLYMDAERVGFDYSYSIGARLLIVDKISGDPLFAPEYELLPQKTLSATGNYIKIREQISIDYAEYNELAKRFIKTYDLKEVSSTLSLTLMVNVLSECEEFEENSQNSYSVALNIPLNSDTLDIKLSSSVAESESKVLACSGAVNQNLFLVIGIIALVLALLQGGGLVAFMYLTRNEDINYSIKVKKLVSAYRSFIQQIDGEFDTMGYQEIYIKSFVELLGIRDTIQSPILMSENLDKTCTKFLIPTTTQLLYVFEIKVDNYDEIYNPEPPTEPEEILEIECSDIEEAIILTNDVDVEAVAEAIATPDVVLSDIEYEMDDDDDFAAAEDEPGVEVIGVVWPEREHKNKVYRYDPNGEQLQAGDVVLVPSRDAAKERDIIRKAAVAHPNHRVEPEHIVHPLKKIIGVVKRKVEAALTPDVNSEE